MSIKTISQQKLLAAAAGNAQLLELLESLMNTVNVTQTATSTTSSKAVPKQATAQVSYLKGNYIVEITNPGATTALSTLQSAQATQNSAAATTTETVTPIFHQIRCATSASFDISSNVQTFGGDTGSTQTYWTLTNLGSGNFYFQFRSSYDGVNFNQWKNANGGQSITAAPETVTLEPETNSDWAVFTLPGSQLIAVGEGYAPDEGTFGLPDGLYSSAMAAIAGPNGYTSEPPQVGNIQLCEVTTSTPSDTSGTTGIPDYAVLVEMEYGGRDNANSLYSGYANTFAIAFDPAGNNVTRYPSSDGISGWAVFTLPGGAKLAVGSGQAANGATIFTPSECPWITSANMLNVCSIQGGATSHGAHGVNQCYIDAALIAHANYADYGSASNVWSGIANWMAVAWTPGLQTETVSGGKFVIITLNGKNKIAFGAGTISSGASFGVPTGFTSDQMLTIGTPVTFSSSGDNNLHGVEVCDIVGTTAELTYQDASGNSWSGNVNWFAFCWADNTTTTAAKQLKKTVLSVRAAKAAVAEARVGMRMDPDDDTGGSWYAATGYIPTTSRTTPTRVSVSPITRLITKSSTASFAATTSDGSAASVTWSVDGVAGGNSTVGTIDSSGNYTAPAAVGTHGITATSVSDTTIFGCASVTVI